MEIESCPFCGSDDLEISVTTQDREGTPTSIACVDCGAVGPWAYLQGAVSEIPIEVVAWQTGWNQRE